MTIDRRGLLAASASALALSKTGVSPSMLATGSDGPEPPPFERVEATEITI